MTNEEFDKIRVTYGAHIQFYNNDCKPIISCDFNDRTFNIVVNNKIKVTPCSEVAKVLN